MAETCGLTILQVETFYEWFAQTEKTVTAWSQGVNQGFDGTDRVNAVINVHLATGRIGLPGCGPLSLTGQPNAMGGREVGGLANQLAAHMDFSDDDIDRVQRFWQAPNIARKPGLTAVDMFSALERGDIRFIWIMGTNPAVSMPDGNKVREALDKCEHVIVSDCMSGTDTGAYADILLPAAPWSEKDGTVTNSERRVSRQRAIFPLAGLARPDWWIVSRVAQKLGFQEFFNYQKPVEIFREHAALSAFENNREQRFRYFNLGTLKSISSFDYERMNPVCWPIPENDTGTGGGEAKRLFSSGQFNSADGRAKFVVPEESEEVTRDKQYPLILNTGRIRDQWHTMTRTARSPRLNRHIDEPYVQVHPADAQSLNVENGRLAQLESRQGKAVVRVKVDDSVCVGQVFMPMHWTHELCPSGLVGPVVHNRTDPLSRQPDSKATPVSLMPLVVDWYGVLFIRKPVVIPCVTYACAIREESCWRYELGVRGDASFLRELLPEGQRLTLSSRTQLLREAVYDADGLQGMLILSSRPLELDRHWLHQQFSEASSLIDWRVISGRSCDGSQLGPVVCTCFGVTKGEICSAVREQGLGSVSELGKALKAGTNCGSCVPELKKLVREVGDCQSCVPEEKKLVLTG